MNTNNQQSSDNSGTKSVFDDFTNLYSLSKTLRFELKPVGNTLDNMKEHLEYDNNLQTFLKDQNIEDAYQELKPKVYKIHENFINNSLESDQAKNIDFSEYLEVYKNKEELGDQEKNSVSVLEKHTKREEKSWKKNILISDGKKDQIRQKDIICFLLLIF